MRKKLSVDAIPARVRKLRESAGLSVTQLAAASGVPERSIRNIETGVSTANGPGVRLLVAVAAALGTTVDGLMSPGK